MSPTFDRERLGILAGDDRNQGDHMGRLFAGTPWDRPPRCEHCGRLEGECRCPKPASTPPRVPVEKQTARLRLEKRPKGKIVSVVSGLDPGETDLEELAKRLKSACGTGGTVKVPERGSSTHQVSAAPQIEIQGDHLDRIEKELSGIGYRIKRA